MSILMCPKSRKSGNHLPEWNLLDTVLCFFANLFHSLHGCVCSFLLFHIRCGRSYQKVSMHSRCDKHPFSILSGQGEHRMTDMCSCGFIQQKIFPFSRRNVELLFTDHIVEFICIYPGCIDDHFCFVHCILCADPISTFHASLNCFHFLLQTEVHTILRCILCQCDI